MTNIPQTRTIRLTILLIGLATSLTASAWSPTGWVAPDASEWVSLYPFNTGASVNPGGEFAVNNTNGDVYEYGGGEPTLHISRNQGEFFSALALPSSSTWQLLEGPSTFQAEGNKLALFSGSGAYSPDGGVHWKVFNFGIQFGFETGAINWYDDCKLVMARSHTTPKRLWISRDSGTTFTEITALAYNDFNMGILPGGVLVTQTGNPDPSFAQWGPLYRSTDTGRTWSAVTLPAYSRPGWSALQFLGIAQRFHGKTFWLTNGGIYTTADTGKSWELVGSPFPDSLLMAPFTVLAGPCFGTDSTHMIVMLRDRFIETVDYGQTWHTLAFTPMSDIGGVIYQYSFAYDINNDILYASHRGYEGSAPYVNARLTLDRPGVAVHTPRSPKLRSVLPNGADSSKLMLIYSEPVDPVTAQTAANYTLNHPATVGSAVLLSASKVILNIQGLTTGLCTLGVSGVKDSATGTADTSMSVGFNYPADAALSFKNSSFETPSVANYQYCPTDSFWRFMFDLAGLQRNGSIFSAAIAPDGAQTAFIQNSGTVAQSFDSWGGQISFSFKAAQRGAQNQTLNVYLDDSLLAACTPSSNAFATYSTPPVTIAAGGHVLKFQGMNVSGDNTAFIDMVTVNFTADAHSGREAETEESAGLSLSSSPNPFNPSTRISFSLPRSQKVQLDIFDAKGGRVAQLCSGEQVSGRHSVLWSAKTASGVYFCRLTTGTGTLQKKLMLLK